MLPMNCDTDRRIYEQFGGASQSTLSTLLSALRHLDFVIEIDTYQKNWLSVTIDKCMPRKKGGWKIGKRATFNPEKFILILESISKEYRPPEDKDNPNWLYLRSQAILVDFIQQAIHKDAEYLKLKREEEYRLKMSYR